MDALMPNARVLWVSSSNDDREPELLESLEGISVTIAASGQECCQAARASRYCAIVANLPLPDCTPDELLEEIQRIDPSTPLVIRDREGTFSDAVRLTKAGAEHYFGADLDVDQLTRIVEGSRQMHTAPANDSELPAWRKFLIGSSRPMEHVFRVIQLVGPRRCTVLIDGETGTGKEVVAKAIHAAGPRSRLPMVMVNCAALPENLLEAELFGHVKGAFTGAANHRVGRFEQANGSTIFLDEIGELPLELQAKLLRVLQEREFQRLGSSETIRVDLRVITASNVDLAQRVKEGKFREDLFYRLNVVPIRTPALRERPSDIPALVEHLMAKICRMEQIPLKRVLPQALSRLAEHPWPGNVRQLENLLEAAIALSGERETLAPADFQFSGGDPKFRPGSSTTICVPDHGLDFDETVTRFERSILMQAMEKSAGNKKQAADMLGLKRTTLAAKLRIIEAA
jgi:DNA-binding NtrC family response regulator